ncbi:MAG: pentapeptide repeat-containing protein [Candidatus Symbiothrix sp.]|nr:pentapeptide repeat-containing protein [Candidatus Symbiothrix sp.]
MRSPLNPKNPKKPLNPKNPLKTDFRKTDFRKTDFHKTDFRKTDFHKMGDRKGRPYSLSRLATPSACADNKPQARSWKSKAKTQP